MPERARNASTAAPAWVFVVFGPARCTFVIAMRISQVEALPFTAPLLAPFGIASGAQPAAANVLVRVTLDDGTVGLGEAAPFPAVNGETQASTLAAISSVDLVGRDARALRPIADFLSAQIFSAASARCALQCAVLDAMCRRARLPMWAYFGGHHAPLQTDFTITTGSLAAAEAAAHDIAARGFGTIKVKVGGVPLEDDVERIRAIAKAAPGLSVILDGNCGISSPSDALAILDASARVGVRVVLFEQPLPKDDLNGQRALCSVSPVPIAADESVGSLADIISVAQQRRAHVVNLKCMKSGLIEAYDMAVTARACGLQLMIGAMVESELALSMSACLAAGLSGFSFVDLDTHMFFASSPMHSGFVQRGPWLEVATITEGHGAGLNA